MILLALSPLFAALAVTLLLALYLLAKIPLPFISAFVKRVGAKFAASVGDSFVLLNSPTQFEAMIRRVRCDLAQLAARCRRVAVIAHSQGAVVTPAEAVEGAAAERHPGVARLRPAGHR